MLISSRVAARAWVSEQLDAATLAKYGLVYVDNKHATTAMPALREIKQRNPQAKVIAYIIWSSLFDNYSAPAFDLRRKLLARFNIGPDWLPLDPTKSFDFRVKGIDGKPIHWENTQPEWIGNIASTKLWQGRTFAEHVAEWAVNDVWRAHRDVFDGLYYDTNLARIDWNATGKDLDEDGVVEDNDTQNRLWGEGLRRLSIASRSLAGQECILIANSPQWEYSWFDGRNLEEWPMKNEPQIDDEWMGPPGSVEANLTLYLEWNGRHFFGASGGPYTVLHTRCAPTEYKRMRSGLAATLMGDGYFICDSKYNDQPAGDEARWYDEYDIELGEPAEAAFRYASGVYRRKYTKAMALLNTATVTRTTYVGAGWRRPTGTQPGNDGADVASVALHPGEGTVLVRK